MDAVVGDVHGRPLGQPDVAIDAAALVPPSFHRVRVDPHGDAVELVAVAGERGDVDLQGVVAAPVMGHDAAVEPDRRLGGDGPEFDGDVLAAIGGIQPQGAAIPGLAAWTVALGEVLVLVERPLHHPVVRQVEFAPVAVVVFGRGRALGAAGLGVGVGPAMALDLRKRHVAQVEAPALIQRRPLAGRLELRPRIGPITPGGDGRPGQARSGAGHRDSRTCP